jgi:hypothetical protein
MERPLAARRMPEETVAGYDWAAILRRAGARLESSRRPHAVAAIAVRPR